MPSNVLGHSRALLTHTQIGQKVGKSREYVSNTVRLLALPQEILDALSMGKINEGHTRPLLMLSSRPEEQATLFKEIIFRKITVREAERIARRIAVDKVRKHSLIPNAELMQIEHQLQESLGTRVHIEPKEAGGKITIDYFSNEDLDIILGVLKNTTGTPESAVAQVSTPSTEPIADFEESPESEKEMIASLDDRNSEEIKQSEEEVEDLYNLKNFSL
jgi:hypothetical protein